MMITLPKPLSRAWLFLFFFSALPFAIRAQGEFRQVSPFENHIHAVVKDVTENCKTTASLTEGDLADLPIGISPQGCGATTILVVDSAYRADRGGWFFNVYASIILPGATQPVAFAARNIAFNQGGLASSTSAKLVLLSPQSVALNEHVRLELPADGHNFIEFDCNGFRSINLKGNFVFDNSLLKPDQELAPAQAEVTASFEVNTGDLNNIMMGVNITPFTIKGLNDLSFEVRNAVADFSDIVNPPAFSFPAEYQQTFGPDIQLWRGFYLQEVNVTIKGMADETGKDPAILAHNLVIDDLGVSGAFGATNLLSLQNGSADGWPLSVDALSIKLMFNKLAGGSLGGFLNVPFLGDEPVPYTALIEQVDDEMNYRFAVTTTDGKEYSTPFSAKIRIDKGSVIALEKRSGKFIPYAKLQGNLTVDNSAVKFKGIQFQDLELTTQKPYLVGGIFSTVGNERSETNGFPLSIDQIKLQVFQGQAAMSFDVALNLMEGKGFSASTTIQLLAKMEEKTISVVSDSDVPVAPKKRQEWKFEKVKVNDISISSETNAFYLKGKLSVYDDDPTYGDGFGGNIAFKINSIMKDAVSVTAYFGSMPTYRYWHLDAYVPTTIPLGPVVTIKGLMGGASYHMTRKQPFSPDFTKLDPEKMDTNDPARNESVFVPDENTGMAFLAGITLVVTRDAVVNADALFEVTFNQHGGLRYVQFTGSAFFFTPTAQRGRTVGNKVPSAPVFANLNMLYDNDNKVFHANLKTYLNVAGILKGTGQNNLVGEAVIHADPKDWYMYIGRPSQMFGVSIAGLATAQTYFMVGTQVEDIPPPPGEVLEIFEDIDPGLMRDGSALRGGRGFATGAHFRVGIDKKIKPFYVIVAVGAGADIMLRDYGDAHCAGRSGKIGIDGWYASGQAYVFLKGKVGIRVKGSNFDIVSVGAAALLQAKLPNPTWLKGQLGGRYSILGGLVKGKFKLKLVVGEECEIVQEGSELDNIKVIEDLKPDDNATDVNVFTATQVSFNTAIDTEFSMMDAQDNLNYYRIKLGEFTVTKNGAPIAGNIEWNAAKDVAVYRTFEILPPQSTLKATVKLYWEKKSGGGSWQVIKQNGQIAYEIKETTFTTGTAPDFIPEENVAYSYPVKNQYHLYVNETGMGYVKLRMGQAYLFEPAQGDTPWEFLARFQHVNGQTVDVPLTYNVAQANATFEIPETLAKQSIYKLFFVKRPVSSGAIDQNLQRGEVTMNSGPDNEMSMASNTLEGTITNSAAKDLYSSAFRTSLFGRFEEKMATLSNMRDLFDVAIGNVAVIGKRGDLSETFDAIELEGKEGQTQPLVQVTASPENVWMKQYIGPMLYDQYPVDKEVTLSWRDPEILGVKPLKGVKLINDQGEYGLTDTNITNGSAPTKSGTVLLGYYLSYYSYKDFNDLRNQAAAKFLNDWTSAPPAAKNLLSVVGFVDLIEGDYPVEIIYALPGTNQVTYRREISIKN